MANRRIYNYKAAILIISGIIVVTLIIYFQSKDSDKPDLIPTKDQSEQASEDFEPPQPPSEPAKQPSEDKLKAKPKPQPSKSNNDNAGNGSGGSGSSGPAAEEYKKAEGTWLKIMALIKDQDLPSIIKLLNEKPELLTAPIFDGKYFLHLACQEGYTELVTELIKRGANVKITTEDSVKAQPIHLAATLDSPDILFKLVEQGAEIDATDTNGETALMYAVICDQLVAAEFLLTRGANPNLLISPTEPASSDAPVHVKTLLNTAISLKHFDLVELLLTHQADPSLVDSLGMNALHAAAFYDAHEAIDRLVATGKVDFKAAVGGKSIFTGKTAMDLAADHEKTLEKLKSIIK